VRRSIDRGELKSKEKTEGQRENPGGGEGAPYAFVQNRLAREGGAVISRLSFPDFLESYFFGISKAWTKSVG
jgi:hypothetical protein